MCNPPPLPTVLPSTVLTSLYNLKLGCLNVDTVRVHPNGRNWTLDGVKEKAPPPNPLSKHNDQGLSQLHNSIIIKFIQPQ